MNKLRVCASTCVVLLLTVGCGGGDGSSEAGLGDESGGEAREELLALAYRTEFISAPEGVSVGSAEDINDRGQVVGISASAAGVDSYLWSPRAGFTTLARLPGATTTTAVAINEPGAVAGTAELEGGLRRPVVWAAPDRIRDIGSYGRYVFESPDSSWSVDAAIATDINDRGHVVGSTSAPEYPEVAYLWSEREGMQLLGTLGGLYSTAWAVNVWDEVVGTAELADGTHHGFLWAGGELLDLGALGGSYSDAYAINDLGVVTGIYQTPSGETRVFRWSRSRGAVDVGPTFAGVQEGITSLSTGLNVFGQIVGGVQGPDSSIRAAVRQPLTGTWQELMPGSPYVSFALAINNLGAIVGRVATSTDFEAPSRAAIWAPVVSLSR
jgi:probable HAF family extracellular repeat protein